jgi:2-dehydropantoate 2-reductase
MERQLAVTRPMGPYRPSSMIDFLAGREVEIDAIWAEPLRRATAAGAHLPAWEKLLARIRDRIAGRDHLS